MLEVVLDVDPEPPSVVVTAVAEVSPTAAETGHFAPFNPGVAYCSSSIQGAPTCWSFSAPYLHFVDGAIRNVADLVPFESS